jgi:hypothetical protein
LDAYIFACDATAQAIDDAVAAVGTSARAALPLLGARRLYVAVEDTTPAGLFTKVADVVTIPGLTGVSTHLGSGWPVPPAMPLPTHGVVDLYVGFSLIRTLPGDTLSVYTAVQAITGVVGVAIVTGEHMSVLVESTAGDEATLATIQSTVASTPGVDLAPTATGAVDLGAGFTTA